jgi:uncharacterized protein (DUF934 family)
MDNLTLLTRLDEKALVLENTEKLEEMSAEILSQKIIALTFPSFMDGRAFSQARRLRRAGFNGELVAAGDVRADQSRLYARVGFSALYPNQAFDKHVLSQDLARFSTDYQTSSANITPIYQKRHSLKNIPNDQLKRAEDAALLSGGGA